MDTLNEDCWTAVPAVDNDDSGTDEEPPPEDLLVEGSVGWVELGTELEGSSVEDCDDS